jgi:hypothetical protein
VLDTGNEISPGGEICLESNVKHWVDCLGGEKSTRYAASSPFLKTSAPLDQHLPFFAWPGGQ